MISAISGSVALRWPISIAVLPSYALVIECPPACVNWSGAVRAYRGDAAFGRAAASCPVVYHPARPPPQLGIEPARATVGRSCARNALWTFMAESVITHL